MEVLAILIPIIVILGLVVLYAAYRRRDRDAATGRLSRETRSADRPSEALGETEPEHEVTGREVELAAVAARTGGGEVVKVETAPPPVPWTAPDPEEVGVSRRQFFNRGIVAFMGLGIAGFGAASLAFLWPGVSGGFGSKLSLGDVDELKQQIRDNLGFLYVPEGRMWVTEYPIGALPKAQQVYSQPELNGMQHGLVALFQKCPHLGCRVPECISSQWFECPCHGSRYNRVGEKRGGPAPRGMDHFATEVTEANVFIVDTGAIIQGPPIGTNTTGQEPEGPSCLGGATHE